MICPNCSYQNEAGVRFCVKCGQPLLEGVLPPQQPPYSYPPPPVYGYPPHAAGAVDSSPWILRSLPFLGAIAVLIGFFLPWFGSPASGSAAFSGFEIFRNEVDSLQILNSSTEAYQMAFINVLLLGITFLIALTGLIALRGSKKSRSLAQIAGLIGIILLISFVGLIILWGGHQAGGFSGFDFGFFLKYLQYGYYISLAGFLWMVITPAFAPKLRQGKSPQL